MGRNAIILLINKIIQVKMNFIAEYDVLFLKNVIHSLVFHSKIMFQGKSFDTTCAYPKAAVVSNAKISAKNPRKQRSIYAKRRTWDNLS